MMKKIMLGLFVIFCLLIISESAFAIYCINNQGICIPNTSRTHCTENGGRVANPGDCDRGGCVLSASQCVYTERLHCQFLASSYGTTIQTFDTAVQSQIECYEKYTSQFETGCCLYGDRNDCRMTAKGACLQLEGDFKVDVQCKELSQCSNCLAGREMECGPNGRSIIQRNNCGDTLDEQPMGANKICVMVDGEPVEKSTICDAGDSSIFYGINVEGKPIIQEKKFTNEEGVRLLGGAQERKHREEWCIVLGSYDGVNWDLYPKRELILKTLPNEDVIRREFSAGQRHFVFTCNEGNVEVKDQCGMLRSEICFQEDEVGYHLVKDASSDDKWAFCEYHGSDADSDIALTGAFRKLLGGRPIFEVTEADFEMDLNTDFAESLFESQIKLEQGGKMDAFCAAHWEEGWVNKCSRSIYPLGNYFYTPSKGNDYSAPSPKCSETGGKWYDFNRPDADECYAKGDCTWNGVGTEGVAKRCLAGAAALETIYLTANTLLGTKEGWGNILKFGPSTIPAAGVLTPDQTDLGESIRSNGIGGGFGEDTGDFYYYSEEEKKWFRLESSSSSTPSISPPIQTPKGRLESPEVDVSRESREVKVGRNRGLAMLGEIRRLMLEVNTGQQLVATFTGRRNARSSPEIRDDGRGDTNRVETFSAQHQISLDDDHSSVMIGDDDHLWAKTTDGTWVRLDGDNDATLSIVDVEE